MLKVRPVSGGSGGRRWKLTNNSPQRNPHHLFLQLSTSTFERVRWGTDEDCILSACPPRVALALLNFLSNWGPPLSTSVPRRSQEASEAAAGTMLGVQQAQRTGLEIHDQRSSPSRMESWRHREGPSAESRAPTTRLRAELQLKDTSVWEAQGRLTAPAGGQPQSTGSISDLQPEHRILD